MTQDLGDLKEPAAEVPVGEQSKKRAWGQKVASSRQKSQCEQGQRVKVAKVAGWAVRMRGSHSLGSIVWNYLSRTFTQGDSHLGVVF